MNSRATSLAEFASKFLKLVKEEITKCARSATSIAAKNASRNFRRTKSALLDAKRKLSLIWQFTLSIRLRSWLSSATNAS